MIQVNKVSLSVPAVKLGINSNTKRGNAISIAVPEPKTISSATGVSKLGSIPLSNAKPVHATPVSIPNKPMVNSS